DRHQKMPMPNSAHNLSPWQTKAIEEEQQENRAIGDDLRNVAPAACDRQNNRQADRDNQEAQQRVDARDKAGYHGAVNCAAAAALSSLRRWPLWLKAVVFDQVIQSRPANAEQGRG